VSPLAVFAGFSGDEDAFEVAGGDFVVELEAVVSAEEAGEELGEGFADDEADDFVLVALDEGFEGGSGAVEGVLDGLAFGGADGAGVVEPLTEELEVSALDFVELETLPEALVEVAEVVEALGAEAEVAADDFGGFEDAFAGAAVEGGEARGGEAGGEVEGLGASALGERDIKDSLHPVLLVIGRGAGPDQDDLEAHPNYDDPPVPGEPPPH
jgi:hypothetical protein